MSGAPRVRLMNIADSDSRSVLGPAGNKTGSTSARKMASKPLRKVGKSPKDEVLAEEKKGTESSMVSNSSPKFSAAKHEQLLLSNLSMNASCSSDASSDSFRSRASTGKLTRSYSTGTRRKSYNSKPRSVASDGSLGSPRSDGLQTVKRCAWVTANTDPHYAAFHDEEWGVAVHDDKKLFEFLVLSGALSELTWPAILSKRQTFREVFADFDPIAVSKLNEKKTIGQGSAASSLLSELKLRAIIENARQICKVIDEFGSFNNYIWSFVNYKPIVSKFRYPRQVPVKTPKADVISKDLVRRGFRSVGPTVIYSFMQVAGLTNDHLTSCFRFHECINAAEGKQDKDITDNAEEKKTDDIISSELSIAIDELSFS